MTTSSCGECGSSLLLMRAGARFCSPNCRLKAHRRARNAGNLPVEMKSRPRFVRFTKTKRPVTTTGRSASSTNPGTWSSHADAVASSKGEGIGFVLGDGIGCIDLDHCLVDGDLADWARQVLADNPGTYVEVSRSGEGLHVFGLLPEGPGRNVRDGVRAIEWYSVGRYIALTGRRFRGAPLQLAPLVVPAL
ncbi:bifunctional DNA primase/polymerase [Curtobacterium sp. MCBD17_003]|uniref:bifunctional DNA primase/polymerase n=1 Tax=Curtobacterium sp. MCBD17_003 TaxID=2175667 RepID=UPI000DA73CB1|nr:bifunctional DNA primase/polymerase [Curtobacterium sp. MCBD17_003]WIE54218.1 bifunctional DNA primase/polymerase [Curtobacterium sp. MCBD17_003]